MRLSPSIRLALIVSGALAAQGCIQFENAQPAAAQRPTLSADTATTADGTFEIETGVEVEPGGAFLVPATVKYGAGTRTELFGTWIPWQRLESADDYEDGIGDVLFGGRHRFLDQDEGRPSLAVQGSTKLPVASAERGLSSGESDVFLAGMATWSFEGWGMNAYYELGLLGDPAGAGLQVAHLPALAVGVGVGEGLSVFGEVAGVFVPERDVESGFGTLGLAWSPEPTTIFDIGARGGIGDEAPDVLLFVGVTHNIGRVRSTP